MKADAVVLLSAGLDSTFNLLKALQQFRSITALTFDYGQKAAEREKAQSKRLAEHFKINHKIIEVPWFRDFTNTSLVADAKVPTGGDVNIEDSARSQATAQSVWVPNRNGIFLNIAAGFAEGIGAGFVIPGFNLEEAQTFPDNSAAFLKALDESFAYSTQGRVRTLCYSAHLTKTQIVSEGLKLKLPFELLWPCYLPGDVWCGSCESCQRFKRALQANDLDFEKVRDKK